MKQKVLIKIELLKKGIKQRDIASALGVSEGVISIYVAGKERSKRFDAWVLLNLGLDLQKIRKDAA